jgi:RNA polymerase sigma-70 factor (ECF subfamily)
MDIETASDHALVQRCQRGHEDAPSLLHLRYAERLRALAAKKMSSGLARRVDAEDVVQSVFRTFFRRAAEGQYQVPEGEEIWKLLLVIALNKIRDLGDFHRAARRDMRRTADGATYDQAIESESGQDDSALTILRLVIDEVLETLPPTHRPIIELRIEGYEMAEISERTRRSKRTVERVVQEFRQSLDARIRDRT